MATPRYLEVVQVLESEVRALPPNSLLPTEHQLARRFGVSRVTIRRALGFLERSGGISRERGRGTIVSPVKVTRRIVPVRTMEQDLQDQGIRLETRVLGYERKAKAPDCIRERLKLGRDKSPGLLCLTRLVHDRVVSFEERYFSPVVAELFNPALLGSAGVIETLEKLAGMPVEKFAWEVQIIPARGEAAKALGVIPGVLTVVHLFTEYLGTGDPLEAGTVSYRIDRVKFELVATGESTAQTGVRSP